MAEELKRRSRLATALIAGPAVTVGLLGIGAAPVLADDEAESPDGVTEETQEPDGDDVDGDTGEDSDDDGEGDGTDEDSDEDADSDDDESDEGEPGDDESDETNEDGEGEPGDDESDETNEDGEGEPGDDESDAVSPFAAAEDLDINVNGSVVEFTGFAEDTFGVTAEHGEQSVGAGTPDEDGNLTFDAAEYISTLDLQPGENELTFSWTWFEDNEEQSDSTTVTVEIEAPDEGDVSFEVDGPVITATGFPEGIWGVDVEAPNGNTTFASVEDDGTLTFDAAQNADVLELGFGETTLTFSWSWSDEFGEHEDSEEVAVTAIPPLETGEDVSTEDIIAGLIGDETGIEDVQAIGQGLQLGRFSGWDALGIPAGIVLSTGDLLESWAAVTGRGGGSLSTDLEGEGDDDLDAILDEGESTQDAAGLEFSFVPEENYVQFSYVFASEEYYQEHPGMFNDIFAFLVNGENYAVFESEDGETLPVAINTINREVNSDLYNENDTDEDGETPHESGVRGFTNVLTFTAPVNPGELNTLKLVIGDNADGIYDSLVFLQSGSFEQISGPVTAGGEFTTEPGEAISGEFELDTNIDDPEWSIEVTDGVDEEAGELEIDGTTWTFTPAEGFTGEASFTFTANDGQLTTTPSTITITVGEEDEDDDDSGDDSTPPEDDDDSTPPEDEGDGDDEGDDSTPPEDDDEGDGDDSGDEGTEDEDESTAPEDDDDAEGGDGSGDGGSKDDQTPAGDSSEDESEDGEDLAKTGLDSAGIGLIAGLLLLVGGGLAIFGYRGRFSRKA